MNVAVALPRSAAARTSRLTVSLSGTNLERAGDYNQRVVLQAIRLAGETSRNDLVRVTGLTAPTIANITRRLVRDGLVRETGRVAQGRGQPAVRLAIDPDGAFGIGLTVDRDRLSLVCLDLAGRVRARAAQTVETATPNAVLTFVAMQVPTLLASADVPAARIVGTGLAVPDGRAWDDLDLSAHLPGPLLRDNDAAAAALGELHFGAGHGLKSFFYLLFCAGLGGGLVIDGNFYRGATGRSGEIGYLTAVREDGSAGRLEERVSLAALHRRLAAVGCVVDADDAAAQAVVAAWVDEAAALLLPALSAVDCLLDPEAIVIGGRLPAPVAEALAARLDALLAGAALPTAAPVRTGSLGRDAPAVGAALLPFLDRLLPSDAILMNAAP